MRLKFMKCPEKVFLWKIRNAAIIILILSILLGFTSFSSLSLRKRLRLCEMSCSMSQIKD